MSEFENLLRFAINAKATDLHICPNETPRMRVDNDIITIPARVNINTQAVAEEIIKTIPEDERAIYEASFKKLVDIDCAFTTFDKTRLRANIYRTLNGISIALRILPSKRISADEIGLSKHVRKICSAKNGIFIVTGASGMGKSTTLAAMIDIINTTRKAHIVTIEDPIENIIDSKMSLVSQREIHRHAPDFYTALRSSMRENPDVIMLGEMRDPETIRVALELSGTGNLVLATMHTRNAISSIDRIIGQYNGDEQAQIRLMLSENLLGVQSQVLLAKRNGGLMAAFEILLTNNAVRNMIREGKTPQLYSILQTNQSNGMCSMEESLFNLIVAGTITIKEALTNLQDPSNMLAMLKQSPKINRQELDNIVL